MSELVFYDDLVTAAVRRLSEYTPFQNLVMDGLIGTDDPDPETGLPGVVWLFQGLDPDGRPFRDPEGSGKSVIVLSERREWAGSNQHNTAYFPALQMLVYTDSTRDADGQPLARDADAKCKHIFRMLNPCFHLPGVTEADQRWPGATGTYHVHSSVKASPFSIGSVPGSNELTVRGEVLYNTITD